MSVHSSAAVSSSVRPLRRLTRGRAAGGLVLLAVGMLFTACGSPPAPSLRTDVTDPAPVPPPPKPQPPATAAVKPPPTPKPVESRTSAAVEPKAPTLVAATPRPRADTPEPAVERGVRTVALPPVPVAPPSDAAALADLLSRPPIAPPVPAPLLVPAGQGPADARCTEATRAARETVLSSLSVPRERLTDTGWVEPILKITELALVACRGDAAGPARTGVTPPPAATQAATYWRATAFLLHGQYARAAVHYRRAAALEGPYAWLGYSSALAAVVDRCAGDHRPALDAWRLAGLLEARGETESARRLYQQAANSACKPLARMAEIRLK